MQILLDDYLSLGLKLSIRFVHPYQFYSLVRDKLTCVQRGLIGSVSMNAYMAIRLVSLNSGKAERKEQVSVWIVDTIFSDTVFVCPY